MPALPVLLFLVFLVLKLVGTIDWSWWAVTAPLWIEFLLALIILFFGLLFVSGTKKRLKADGWTFISNGR